ncbi:hypothetical protein VE25_16225 [Devosia geojensis]|uniref:DNA gyrase inhibitor YacG n=1 Tax=Devosia geojensis TaxID=443610 RepID=A0A0F5FQB6_9HYPH|nr:DNA gyrase inhibitor YacG [Devosia geojensis]KKB10775.1 hypothetical protein VE25_16225 [Devosia geojensis]
MPETQTIAKPCPICGKPSVEKYRPFCSKRCADVDLNRWLSGSYVIPATADPEPEDGDDVPTHSRDPEDDNI